MNCSNENIELVRLEAKDYEECFALMDLAFMTSRPGHPHFRAILPKMCVPDDEHMHKHLAVRRGGKLRAVLGIYPLPVIIGGRRLMCSTVGNVATHPDEQGKGYMTMMLNEAMKGLDEIGADLSRLGGLRQRYNRWGYERAGMNYSFSLTARNVKLSGHESGITFRAMERGGLDALHTAEKLFYTGKIACDRLDDENFWLSMIAWQNSGYAAYLDGRMIGYLVTKDGSSIAEAFAETPELYRDMLFAWLRTNDKSGISFSLAPWQPEEVRLMSAVCESYSVGSPCHFKIIHWDTVADALIRLEASYTALAKGELILGIEDWGNLRLYVDETGAGAEKTDRAASLTLDRLEATRFLFGTLPPCCTGEASEAANAWLPLPLSWNLQDRV